ncbi:MAE_28990/MAE_18760 family HEPN-like nuclease [Desulfotomaculum nigrificans]|uniref:MAE_28990/MAE_18760 family HEPN-like nuclease n=1 Tax=Desulfotomaculum nigrificans TaxID=1565 RepID=UPI0001FAE791|nr:MAE_28990/MAE_18760 family HEPN-like nuclease [Desulfotomaculum nigrificans]
MKIKTIEKLQDKLDEDLSWRKKELLEFKHIINSGEHESVMVRAGIALLCAHFEGFIRLASNFYVVFVSYKKVPCKEIKNNFLVLRLKKKFTECGKTEKVSVHKSLFEKLEQIQEEHFFVKYSDNDRIISTESNPTFEVLCEIMESIGLEFLPFESKRNYIDFNLLKNRHEIVHGERTNLTKNDFMDTFDIIMGIMEDFKDIILNAAEDELYLKSKSS